MPQAQAAQNVTFPAHSFMAGAVAGSVREAKVRICSIDATPVLGAVAGPVREAKARLSSILESLNI